MTSKYELMRHALGVRPYTSKDGTSSCFSKPYRNHFVASGDNVAIWEGLVADGFAAKSGGVYYVTHAGQEAALAGITFKRRWGYGRPKDS